MKSVIFKVTIFCAVFFITVCSCFAEECSTARAAGRWGFIVNGWGVSPPLPAGPTAGVGHFTLNRDGSISHAVWTVAPNGNVSLAQFTGSIKVNDDCTGTGTFNLGNNITIDLDAIYVDHMQEVYWIFKTPGSVITAVGKRIFPLFWP